MRPFALNVMASTILMCAHFPLMVSCILTRNIQWGSITSAASVYVAVRAVTLTRADPLWKRAVSVLLPTSRSRC